jgi:hypothetical protein
MRTPAIRRRSTIACGLVGGLAAGCALAAGCTAPARHAVHPRTVVPEVRVAVAQWRAAGGSSQIETLAADFASMARLRAAPDWQVAQSCYHLLVDVGVARAYEDIPDPVAQQLWAGALDAYARGGIDCAHGADSHNYGMVARAAAEFDAGTANIHSLTIRLNGLR